MNTITINLPATFAVESRGKTLSLDLAAIPASIFEKAALHGIKQKVADAAAGAAKAAFRDKADGESLEAWQKAFDTFKADEQNADKIAMTGLALMQKVADNLLAGDWGIERGAGSAGLSVLEVEMAKIMASKMEFAKGVKTAERYALALAEIASRPADTQATIKKLAQRELDRQAELKALDF